MHVTRGRLGKIGCYNRTVCMILCLALQEGYAGRLILVVAAALGIVHRFGVHGREIASCVSSCRHDSASADMSPCQLRRLSGIAQ